MLVSDELREYFAWTLEGTRCAIKLPKNAPDWILELPRGQSIRLSSAELASLKTNLRRLPDSAIHAGRSQMMRAGLPWTAEDEALLKSMFQSGLPLETIAMRLGRSRYAVELHLVKLGLAAAEVPKAGPAPTRTRA